jgi:hypothetical protein
MALELVEAQPRLAGCDLVFYNRNGRQLGGWSNRLAPIKAELGEPGVCLSRFAQNVPHGACRVERCRAGG